jgi:hypothetical protein
VCCCLPGREQQQESRAHLEIYLRHDGYLYQEKDSYPYQEIYTQTGRLSLSGEGRLSLSGDIHSERRLNRCVAASQGNRLQLSDDGHERKDFGHCSHS